MILNGVRCDILVVCIFVIVTKFAVHSAIVTETTVEGLFNEDYSFHKKCAEDSDCRGRKQYCNTAIKVCECQPFYQYLYDNNDCSPCPREGEECMGCCAHSNLQCYYNVCIRCEEDSYECDYSQSVFMNASQIALVAALIMGAAALATLLYRICTKPTYFGRARRNRSTRNAEETESPFQRIARTSLSSIQIRVISRLRDRPPKYETQHNYDTRIQREGEEVQRTNSADTGVVTTPALSAAEHAPPPYDGSKESVNELPPPYSDTGHETLPDVVLANWNISSQVGGTSQLNETPTISIISSVSTEGAVASESSGISDNKSIHM